MPSVQDVLDRYADGTPYDSLAAAFLEFERPPGDDPVLLLADAAASTTGQRYASGVWPTVERFRDAFVDSGRTTSFSELAALELADDDLIEAFGAERKRRVLLEAAGVLAARPEDDALEAVRGWASEADPYRYDADPIGTISGVGPSTFQYLRQLAGIDAVKPDPRVGRLVAAVAEETDSPMLDASERLRTIASCEWMTTVSSYRMLEIDRIAWWTFADEDEREAVTALES